VVAPLWMPWKVVFSVIGFLLRLVYLHFDSLLYFQAAEILILLAMAHMKAQSSLAIAVTITCLAFPLVHSLL